MVTRIEWAGMIPAQPSPDPQHVRDQLERILASPAFAGSELASAFLRYVVEETLRSPAALIKEVTIGAEAFGKGPNFDPKLDPVVRIYGGRVRERLDRYYDTEGRNDPIRIEMPKGSYVPEFHAGGAASMARKIHVLPAPAPRVWPWKKLAIAAVVAAGIFAIFVLRRPTEPVAPRQRTAQQLTFDPGLTTDGALTRDGHLVAFASDRSGRGDLDIWVRQVEGGEPIRLTTSEADEREPSFSPDGTKIAFHSTRDGGGLYVMHALGGESAEPARKIASSGRRPRFSPDGKWIAYWVGSSAFNHGSVHVAPASGGNSRILHDTLQAISHPVWDPASKHVLVLGRVSTPRSDWVVVPLDGGPVVETGLRKYLESTGVASKEEPLPDAWEENEVFFTSRPSLTLSSSRPDDLWKIRLQPGSWSPIRVERLTQGSGQNAGVAIAANGTVVFSGLRWSRGLYELGAGTLTRFRGATGSESFPSLSAKGDRLAFVSDRSGSTEVWLRDMKTGREEMLTEGKELIGFSRISPDGKKVAYATSRPQGTFVTEISGRLKAKVCEGCSPIGWSPDSEILSVTLVGNLTKNDSSFYSVAERREVARFVHPKYGALAARFSPDGRWVALNVKFSDSVGVIHLVPWTGSAVPPEKWIPITEAPSSAHLPEWSPDGQFVYYISNRFGSYDLWRVAVSKTGSSAEPSLVRRFDASLNLGRRPLPFAVGPDRIVLSLEQTTGNLWILQ